MKQSFVHQVLDHRLAANVQDECDPRSQLCDIGEVLFGADSDISAAGRTELSELIDDREIRRLIGNQIVGEEVPALFGEVANQRGELGRR